MDSIYARKRKCEKHNRDLIKSGTSIGEINEAVASFSDDKWNPGDIWMSTVNPEKDPFSWTPQFIVKPKYSKQYATGYFKNFKDNMYETSLELYYKEMENLIEYKEGILPEDNTNTSSDESFTFGNGDFFNSADVYIEFNSGKIQFRPYATTKSWQGEIKGTKASGGKAGGAPTNYYAELFFGRSIDKTEKIASGTWQEFKGTIGGKGKNISEKKKMYELYKKQNKNQKPKRIQQ